MTTSLRSERSISRGGIKLRSYYVPPRLVRLILGHLLRNLNGQRNCPLFQCWVGLPGTGKTSCIIEALNIAGVKILTFDAVGFESDHAGEPARYLLELFNQAKELLQGRTTAATPTALLINDLDLGCGRLNDSDQHTINQQVLITTLQDLADRYSVRLSATQRPAIYFTVNESERLPASLLRPARTDVRQFQLLPAEMEEVVQNLFPQLVPYHVQVLVEHFPTQPIAFYGDLRRRVQEQAETRLFRQYEPRELVRLALQRQIQTPACVATLETLITLGTELLHDRLPITASEVEVAEA